MGTVVVKVSLIKIEDVDVCFGVTDDFSIEIEGCIDIDDDNNEGVMLLWIIL